MSKGKTITIFDDDEDILSICRYLLEARGWLVHTFTDVRNVLASLEHTNPDVVLMDNWIPDAGGIISTRLIKESLRFKGLPVVYFSANSDIESLAAQAGADNYIAKPFSLDEFESKIFRYAGLLSNP